MGNRVEVELAIDDSRAGRQSLMEVDNALNKIGDTARVVSGQIDAPVIEIVRSSGAAIKAIDLTDEKLKSLAATARLYGKEISQSQLESLRSQGIPAIEAATNAIQLEAKQQRILRQEVEATNKARQATPSGLRRSEAITSSVAVPLDFEGRLKRSELGSLQFQRSKDFADDAASAKNLERVTQRFGPYASELNKAGGATKRLTEGSAELRQSLISLSGVPYPEAVNQLFKITGIAPGAGIALALAGGAAIALTEKVSGIIREKAEATLKAIQSASVVKQTGLRGGTSQIATDLQELEKLRREAGQLARAGAAGDAEQLISEQLGQGANFSILESRINQVGLRFKILQKAAFSGGEENIFDEAEKRFLENAGETVSVNQIQTRLAKLREEFLSSDQTLTEYNKKLNDFGTELKRDAQFATDAAAGSEEFRRKQEKLKEATQQLREGLRDAFRGIQATNPYISLFQAAEDRARQFQKNFARIGGETANEFKRQLKDSFNVDVLKEDLNSILRVSNIQKDRDTLEFAQPFSKLQDKQRVSDFLELSKGQSEIDNLRFGDRGQVETTKRQIQRAAEQFTGAALSQIIANATEGLSQSQLESSRLGFRRQNALQVLQNEREQQLENANSFKRRQIERAEELVNKADSSVNNADIQEPLARRAAESARIDTILQATNLPPELLNPNLREKRFAAQDAKIQLETQQKLDASQFQQKQQQTLEKLANAVDKFVAATPEFLLVQKNFSDAVDKFQSTEIRVTTDDDTGIERLGRGFDSPVRTRGTNRFTNDF